MNSRTPDHAIGEQADSGEPHAVSEVSLGPEKLERLFDMAPIGLCYFDTELRFRYINSWLARINGLPVQAHLGERLGDLLEDVAARIGPHLNHVLTSGEPIVDGEVMAETRAHPGERRCYRHSYHADKDASGNVLGVCCVVQDITLRKRAEQELNQRNEQLETANERLADVVDRFKRANEALQQQSLEATQAKHRLEKARKQLQRLALYDRLTGLGNRILFSSQIDQLLQIAESKNKELAVLAMDLDGFKLINDQLGHAAGDEVLRQFAARLREVLKRTAHIYRLGGDEFAVLLAPRCGAFEHAVASAESIARHTGLPLEILGHSCSIGVSIGIAVYPEHGREASVLIRKADAAMYEAKKKQQVLAGASELGATTVLRRLRSVS